MELRLARQLGIGILGILARLIKLENAAGGFDVEAAKLVFQLI